MIKGKDYIRLGIFVITGLAFLILLLYLIGKNRNLFDKTITVKSRFENVHGLMVGNNVRFAGIEVGTVYEIEIVNDSCIEVSMVLKKEMEKIIKKNAIVTIGTEGFVGYKLINIENRNENSSYIQNGDLLNAKSNPDTDEIIETLSKTINEISIAAVQLNEIMQKVNSSDALWTLANDDMIRQKLHASLGQIQSMSKNLNAASGNIKKMTQYVQDSNGLMNTLLYDTTLAGQVSTALYSIENIGKTVNEFEGKLSKSIKELTSNLQNGNGVIPTLIHDSLVTNKLNTGLDHILLATKNLNQNMEALKHNFLFRKYFKKLEKEKRDSLKKVMLLNK
jgi:phospholipid/cholesterol/gamma-HCH transport system substrate-binding protein